MGYAITLRLDCDAASRVSEMWSVLAKHNLAFDCIVPGNSPHLSLLITDHVADTSETGRELRSWANGRAPINLEFTGFGLFPGTQHSVCLFVVPTRELLEMHHALEQGMSGFDINDNYRHGRWIPHVTLARTIQTTRDLGAAFDVLLPLWRPFSATCGCLELVHFLPVELLESVELS
jgi:2'-5' RNA ligase